MSESRRNTGALRVAIAAGGTGGHMFPAQAFAEAGAARGWRMMLLTDDRGARFVTGFPPDTFRVGLPAAALSGGVLQRFSAVLTIRKGVRVAKGALRAFRPDVVAGFGGYPAFPAMVAARGLRLPLIIQEQNAVLGRVNRRYARYADAVASAFGRLDRAPGGINQVVTGTLTRAQARPFANAAWLDTDGGLRILVTGGSQGARALSEPVAEAVAALPEAIRTRLHVTHQARPEYLDAVRAIYANAGVDAQTEAFFGDLPARIAASHLIVSRAGASSVAEIALIGRPSILIPLAIATDDHQTANAEALSAAGAADVLQEADLTPPALSALLARRLGDPADLKRRAAQAAALGRPDAADRLVALAEAAVNRKER